MEAIAVDNWTTFKHLLADRKSERGLQYEMTAAGYRIFFVDGNCIVEYMMRLGDPNHKDFEHGLKAIANRAIARIDRENALPKMVKSFSETVNGVATVKIQVPGVPFQSSRFVKGAFGKFDAPASGDFVEAWVSDESNYLGNGAGAVVRSFTDEDAPEINHGWWLFPSSDGMRLEGFEDLMEVPAGLWIVIRAVKGDAGPDKFRVNVYWGRRE